MEQHVGHYTYYQNLRRFIDADRRVQASWARITYEQPDMGLSRSRFVPRHLRPALAGSRQVIKALMAAPCDVAFFNTQVPAVLGGAWTYRQPFVISTDITPLQYDAMAASYQHEPDRRGPYHWMKYHANRLALRKATRLLPWSHWAADSLRYDYGAPADRICVTPPGVDVGLWRAKCYDEPTAPLKVLFVGADFRRKGGETLLRAFQALPTGSAELHIATRTPLAAAPCVHVYIGLTPNSAELIELFRACDVFVLPSLAEAFGIVAVEASAAGLPVIATRSGGLPDIVAEGETGFLLSPGDAAALTQCLGQFVADRSLCVRMGHAARLRAEQHFDAHMLANQVVGQLCEIANKTEATAAAQGLV
jgi:glycosyltransferase involved in cell wall biosynthesis